MSDSVRPHRRQLTRLLCPWDSPGKNTGVGCHFLLQGIFPTQGMNSCLPHWQGDSLPLNHLGSLYYTAREISVHFILTSYLWICVYTHIWVHTLAHSSQTGCLKHLFIKLGSSQSRLVSLCFLVHRRISSSHILTSQKCQGRSLQSLL